MRRISTGRRDACPNAPVRRIAPTTSAACYGRPELLEAREAHAAGRLDDEGLAQAEDEAIRDVVRMQEEAGLQTVTDGEFRRASWHMDFIYSLDGVSKAPGNLSVQFHNAEGDIEFTPAALHIDGKLGVSETIFERPFTFLQEVASEGQTPKLTIPSPSMVHYRGGRAAVDESVYPDMDGFWDDLTSAYAEEVRRLGELGCTYLQFDDTSLAYLNDPKQREMIAAQGSDAEHLHESYISPHQRGARRSARRGWRSRRTCAAATSAPRGSPRAATTSWPRRCSASSTSTASSWSGTTRARAGSSRCATCPKGKQVVLGLVTTKRGELESKDDLKRRIEEASQYVDVDQLCLSPQCGFSSTVEGNALSREQQAAKLALIVETAKEVWG